MCEVIILVTLRLLRSLTLKSLLSCSALVFKTKQLNPQYSTVMLLVEYCGNQLIESKQTSLKLRKKLNLVAVASFLKSYETSDILIMLMQLSLNLRVRMMSTCRVAVLQLTCTNNKNRNREKCQELLHKAKSFGKKISSF